MKNILFFARFLLYKIAILSAPFCHSFRPFTTNTQEEITTNTVAVHELILRYNNEIEKAKKQKMKCLEVLLKFGETQNQQQTEQAAAVNIYLPDNDRG